MSNLFSSGPRLSEPSGDPKRQAVDSLRGYAYQLYASAMAWLRLKTGEHLYLEVAEDYAIAARGVLEGVQVKDTHGSGGLTINSKDIRDALNNFIDLKERNPNVVVNLRFFSTAFIGVEKELVDRANGEAVLLYWRRAALNADVEPLRKAILRADIEQRVRSFIEARNDDELREEFLKKIHWDCGKSDLQQLKSDLASALVEYGSERLRLSPRDAEPLPASVLAKVLDVVLCPIAKDRRLDSASLLRLCEEVSRTSLPKTTIEALLVQALSHQSSGVALQEIRSVLEPEEQVPMPLNLLPRQNAVHEIRNRLSFSPVLFLWAGTGMGKTIIARLTARACGGRWLILELRDLAADECEYRIRLAMRQAATLNISGVIVDDLNQLEASKVAIALACFVQSLQRQDALCLVTCYRPASAGTLDGLGLAAVSNYQVPALDKSEVATVVYRAGGDPGVWTHLVYFQGGFGHPQLVRVVVSGLRHRKWSLNESGLIASVELISEDIEGERETIRRKLIGALSEESRSLLYRVSLFVGRFARSAALQLGAVSPVIKNVGEYFDVIVGPWIDVVGKNLYRASPLVLNVGETVLLPSEQTAVHKAIVRELFSGNALNVTVADELFVHASKGQCVAELFRLAEVVVFETAGNQKALATWMPSLRVASADKRIFENNAAVSRLLRLAQLLMLLSIEASSAHVLAVWQALERELMVGSNKSEALSFEIMSLWMILSNSSVAKMLPNWFALLRRMRSIVCHNNEFYELLINFKGIELPSEQIKPNVFGVLFAGLVSQLSSVEAQLHLFRILGAIPAEERAQYIEFSTQSRDGTLSMTSSPWIAEMRRGDLDGARASKAYLEMASLAAEWNIRPLAISFTVAAVAMADEYSNESSQALEILESAEREFGKSIDLTWARARARVHFRHKRHEEVLIVAGNIEKNIEDFTASERIYLCRELAISSAETGNWAAAADWFGKAYSFAVEISEGKSKAMAVGLKADKALALFRAGFAEPAVTEYAEVLEQLAEVDVEETLEAAYCSRVVRHSVSWLLGQSTGTHAEQLLDGKPLAMVAGMCSNPNPVEAIRKIPLASLDLAWYLFVPTECLVFGANEAFKRLDVRLGGKYVPALEIMVRKYCLDMAIRKLSVMDFVSQLMPWGNTIVYSSLNRDSLMRSNLHHPQYEMLSQAVPKDLLDPLAIEAVQQAVLAMGLMIAMSGKIDLLGQLKISLEKLSGFDYAKNLVEVMLNPNVKGDSDNWRHGVAVAIRDIINQVPYRPEQAFVATLRFLQVTYQSRFQREIEESLVLWVRNVWMRQIENRFAFKFPGLIIPEIERAMCVPGLPGVAALLLAAEPGLSVRLGVGFPEYLKGIVDK